MAGVNMCGVAGVVHRDGRNAAMATVKAMTDAVAHRGPDGEGHLLERCVGLGHRRLAILDLSERGRQPMNYRNSGLTLTFNGEIYNYIELRAELAMLGYSFASDTDSEVILAAYERWGFDCMQRFNGMWALAILDRRRRIIFLSRDRFGVKPLYYVENNAVFAFGSEIRQLLPFLSTRQVNVEVLRTYLVTDAAELGDTTFFHGIRRIPGSHYAVYDLERHRFEVKRYYAIPRRPEPQSVRGDEAIEMFNAVFEDAVRLRLRSDVRVGTCLSGGLDSSSVATVASRFYHDSSADTFSAVTAVSEEAKSDESAFARMVADASGLNWLTVRPSYKEFADSLPQVVESQEEPFGGPSVIMQHFVMKTAREKGIKVLLDGQGGDETLLGYEKYYTAYIISELRRGGIGRVLPALFAIPANNSKMNAISIAKYSAAGLIAPARYFYYKRRHSYFRDHGPIPPHLIRFAKSLRNVFDLQVLELESTSLPVLLRYEDKNSMAHSIEARLPFLDYRLVELNLSLPETMKINNGWTKWILRKAMDGRMPDPVVWRKNKFGFEAPEHLWLKAHHREMEKAVFGSPLIKEHVDLRRLKAGYGRLDGRSKWRLYSLALWAEKFRIAV
jgi:asparagine synthase (glutamine-hydrolysing)